MESSERLKKIYRNQYVAYATKWDSSNLDKERVSEKSSGKGKKLKLVVKLTIHLIEIKFYKSD